MKKVLLTSFILIAFSLVNAQNSETRSLDSFDKVSVAESIDLIMKNGEKNEASIETSGVDTEDVLTEVKDGKLTINMNRGSYRSTNVKVFLTYKKLSGIKVSSSASLKSESVVEASDLKIRVSSSGRATLKVAVNELQVAVSSSGRLELNGTAKVQRVDVSSSGRYSAYGLESKELEADVSSSGRVEVFVTERINANASSSGRVTYKGNPDKVIADSSSSGKVRRAE